MKFIETEWFTKEEAKDMDDFIVEWLKEIPEGSLDWQRRQLEEAREDIKKILDNAEKENSV